MRVLGTTVLLFSILACGPSGRDNTPGGVDASDPTVDAPDPDVPATITGRVWAPNQAPGQAAPGQEIPISGAVVYVSTTKPDPIPAGVYCEQCVATPNGGVLTGPDGSFTLDVFPGRYWVVIQKGQFRIESEYDLQAGRIEMTPEQTTLPSKHDPSMGLYIPKIAIGLGASDRVEDVLGKLGLGTMIGNDWDNGAGENGPEMIELNWSGDASTPGSVAHLLSNIDELRKYHIVFFPCNASIPPAIEAMLRDQAILANIRRYVNEGGKLYVTDWSGEFIDRAFPPQLELGDAGADTMGTYDPVSFTGTLDVIGDANGDIYNLDDGKAVDPDLNAWLGLQSGPTPSSATPTMYNPDAFRIVGLYNWVKKINSVQLGVDDMDMPVYDTPKSWVSGSKNVAGGANRPVAVTFQPTGCGKVLYTPFQTSTSVHAGLWPQERILVYLIMEIQTCSNNPIF